MQASCDSGPNFEAGHAPLGGAMHATAAQPPHSLQSESFDSDKSTTCGCRVLTAGSHRLSQNFRHARSKHDMHAAVGSAPHGHFARPTVRPAPGSRWPHAGWHTVGAAPSSAWLPTPAEINLPRSASGVHGPVRACQQHRPPWQPMLPPLAGVPVQAGSKASMWFRLAEMLATCEGVQRQPVSRCSTGP